MHIYCQYYRNIANLENMLHNADIFWNILSTNINLIPVSIYLKVISIYGAVTSGSHLVGPLLKAFTVLFLTFQKGISVLFKYFKCQKNQQGLMLPITICLTNWMQRVSLRRIANNGHKSPSKFSLTYFIKNYSYSVVSHGHKGYLGFPQGL